jgi:hypothetical protein
MVLGNYQKYAVHPKIYRVGSENYFTNKNKRNEKGSEMENSRDVPPSLKTTCVFSHRPF